MSKIRSPFINAYDNDVDIYVPEFWANEAMLQLRNSLVFGNLVHRDFENLVQRSGDTVNIDIPNGFIAHRKTDDERVRLQDVSAGKRAVKLDQHWHTSFIIKDGEESKSYKDLIDTFIAPAMQSIAEAVDKTIAGQYVRFLNRSVGRLGGLTAATAKDYILDARRLMNDAKVPLEGRNMLLSGGAETEVLKLDNFLNSSFVGDDGTSLREASIGRKLGFDFLTSSNIPDITGIQAKTTTTTAAAASAGAGTVTLTSGTGITAGMWFTIAGDDTPLQVASIAGAVVTLYLPLKRGVANGAAVAAYNPGTVNQNAPLTSRGITVTNGYPAGWHREIVVATVTPQVGQGITFANNNGSVYTVINVDPIYGIELDRPLEFAIAHADKVNIAPAGAYNFAFHRNAIALVTRPLAPPRAGTGALSSVVNDSGYAIRSTITYQGMDQGHLVTLDMLTGVAPLDESLGVVLLG